MSSFGLRHSCGATSLMIKERRAQATKRGCLYKHRRTGGFLRMHPGFCIELSKWVQVLYSGYDRYPAGYDEYDTMRGIFYPQSSVGYVTRASQVTILPRKVYRKANDSRVLLVRTKSFQFQVLIYAGRVQHSAMTCGRLYPYWLCFKLDLGLPQHPE